MNLGCPFTMDVNDQQIDGGGQATTILLSFQQQYPVVDS